MPLDIMQSQHTFRHTFRKVASQIRARKTSDGDGVVLQRVFGGFELEHFDPFLMLDEFGADEPKDYLGGFPSHPHRGFETVTYLLQGKMEHRDHMGNVGLLNDGDVQWMTIGRGVIHSEMPQQTEGKLRGFQLWINLPSAKKMQPARYKDVAAVELPRYGWDGLCIAALAGHITLEGRDVTGFFLAPHTEVVYLDLQL